MLGVVRKDHWHRGLRWATPLQDGNVMDVLLGHEHDGVKPFVPSTQRAWLKCCYC